MTEIMIMTIITIASGGGGGCGGSGGGGDDDNDEDVDPKWAPASFIASFSQDVSSQPLIETD